MGFWKGLGTACLVLTMGFCAFIGYAERESIKETWNTIFNQEQQQVEAETKIDVNLTVNYFDEENKMQELMQVKKSADVNFKDNLYSVVAQISFSEINQNFNQSNLSLVFDTSNVTAEEDYSVTAEIKTDEQTQAVYYEFIVSSSKALNEVNISLTLQTIVIQEIKMPYTVSAYYSTYVDEFVIPSTEENYSLPKKSVEYTNLEAEDPNGASFMLYNANGLFSEQFIVFNMIVPESFAETDYTYQNIGVEYSKNFDITQLSVENNFIYIEISPNATVTSWEELQLFEISLFYGKKVNE